MMFQKIESRKDFEHLLPGTAVILYPLSCIPQEDISLSDEDSFSLFEVIDTADEKTTISLHSDDPLLLKNLPPVLKDMSYQENKLVITKALNEVIGESTWWYRKNSE